MFTYYLVKCFIIAEMMVFLSVTRTFPMYFDANNVFKPSCPLLSRTDFRCLYLSPDPAIFLAMHLLMVASDIVLPLEISGFSVRRFAFKLSIYETSSIWIMFFRSINFFRLATGWAYKIQYTG